MLASFPPYEADRSRCRLSRLAGIRLPFEPCQKLAFEILHWHGPAEEVTLPLLAPDADQQIGAGTIFDTFGDDRKAKLFAQPDRRADDGSVTGIREQVPHERPVDLEPVERKFLEVAETGIAGPKSSNTTRTPSS
jgi:hypothetical protein